MMVNIAFHRARGLQLILDAHEGNPEMLGRLERAEHVRDAPRKLVNFRTSMSANAASCTALISAWAAATPPAAARPSYPHLGQNVSPGACRSAVQSIGLQVRPLRGGEPRARESHLH
jgi:hypothetical protein